MGFPQTSCHTCRSITRQCIRTWLALVCAALFFSGCTEDVSVPSSPTEDEVSHALRQPPADLQQADLDETIEAYRLAHRRFYEVAANWRATEQAVQDAEQELQATHERVLAFIEEDVHSTADAFREATAAGAEGDRLLWMNFIQTLVGLSIIDEAHHEARQDALTNIDVIADFHALYPEAQGAFVYHRGDLDDVWWESVAVLYGRYQFELALPVTLSEDLRRIVEAGEPAFTVHEYEEAGESVKRVQFGLDTWEKVKAAQGRIEHVFERITVDDPVDLEQDLIPIYEQGLAETGDEHEREAIESQIRTLRNADEIHDAYEEATEHAIEQVEVIREFHKLFAEATSSFGRFAAGWADAREMIPWRSEVVLHGRYELTLQLDVGLSEDGRRVVRTSEPVFYLDERRWVQRLPDGRLSIAYDPTHHPQQFGLEEWRKVVAADGDLSGLGFEVITDEPIGESPDPAPPEAFPAQPVDP